MVFCSAGNLGSGDRELGGKGAGGHGHFCCITPLQHTSLTPAGQCELVVGLRLFKDSYNVTTACLASTDLLCMHRDPAGTHNTDLLLLFLL